ncbi:hypothetical protein [Bacteroides sp.]|uniref:hypothetical protein n=1 Tax=Bacteroides sp. TaxID=29523 RepID=UPI002630A390|nr:hypothetical protein [Bacteroides sp.]MDD3038652.1 hypothetical protein [Bacteroides sp.]
MEKQLRYKGEFFSVAGVRWRVEIWQDAQVPYLAVGELRFPADSPLVFEWAETDKLEPVQGSAATLQIVSKADRQYKDLYTVEAGSVRMDAYRNDVLYWSGTMDTEIYEEPFSYEKEYEVKLTFSDFAMLEQRNFSLRGARTIGSLIESIIAETKINHRGITRHISTTCPDMSGEMLDAVAVSCENFYDEEGAPLTMREVLDEILRPFALRLVQRAGNLFIYDLNALQTTFEPETVRWESDDAVLGVDKIYKNVTLSFSPYPQKELYTTTLTKKLLDERADCYYVAKDNGQNIQARNNIGFMIDLKKTPGVSGELEINTSSAMLFKITPVYSGYEAFGIASRVRNVHTLLSSSYGVTPIDTSANSNSYIFKVCRTLSLPETRSIFESSTSGVADFGATNIMLRLKVEALIDARYNPFEEATDSNEKGGYEKLQNIKEYSIAYKLRIKDLNGDVKMHYENKVQTQGTIFPNIPKTYYKEIDGKWVDGDVVNEDPWVTTLNYYDNGYTAWNGGWKTNKVGYSHSYIPRDSSGDGDLIPIPVGCQGYTLELTVIGCFGRRRTLSGLESLMTDSQERPKWILYKMPELTLVNHQGKEIEGNDIEYKSWLNSSAKEEKKIETIVGTPNTENNFGMGILMKASSRVTLYKFTRAGITTSLEKLLIGTWYSNYNKRMNTLSGTVRLLNYFGTYTDANENGTYLMVSDVQDVIMDESNVKLAEIAVDNFEGIVYE